MNPLTYLKLGILALLLAIIGVLYVKLDNAQDKHAKHLAADAKAILRGKDIIINTERRHMAALAAVDAQLTKDHNDALANRDAVIAGLRTGTVRVRDRFRCAPIGRVSRIATPAGTGDAAPEGGLSDSDAGTLIGIASEADQVALQLGACQAVVAGDRK